VRSESLLCSQGRGNVLDLLLNNLLGLAVEEVVEFQLQFCGIVIFKQGRFFFKSVEFRLSLGFGLWILIEQPLLLVLHQTHIFFSSEIAVLLQEKGVVFVLVEVQNCVQILLVEILGMELAVDDVSFLQFVVSAQQHLQILFDLGCCLGFNFRRNAFEIIDGPPPESFHELVKVFSCPLYKPLEVVLFILLLKLRRNWLRVLSK